MNELSLVIVEDHPLFRQGIVDTLSLEADFRVIGQSAHGEQGLELIRSLCPDIAIIDVNLPGMNGQQITHELGADKIRTRVILLTAYDDAEQTLHAAIAGAFAYCSKDIQPEDLLVVIRTVAAGLYVINNQVMTHSEFKSWIESQIESSRRSYSEPGSPFIRFRSGRWKC